MSVSAWPVVTNTVAMCTPHFDVSAFNAYLWMTKCGATCFCGGRSCRHQAHEILRVCTRREGPLPEIRVSRRWLESPCHAPAWLMPPAHSPLVHHRAPVLLVRFDTGSRCCLSGSSPNAVQRVVACRIQPARCSLACYSRANCYGLYDYPSSPRLPPSVRTARPPRVPLFLP